MIAAYETRIGKLEQEKLVITEKLESNATPRHSFEELFELAFDFLRNPWKLWDSGQLTLKCTVLRLAFRERVTYCRNEGLRTPKMALPFKLLTGLEMDDLEMVHLGGESSNTLFDILSQWNQVLEAVSFPANSPKKAVCRGAG